MNEVDRERGRGAGARGCSQAAAANNWRSFQLGSVGPLGLPHRDKLKAVSGLESGRGGSGGGDDSGGLQTTSNFNLSKSFSVQRGDGNRKSGAGAHRVPITLDVVVAMEALCGVCLLGCNCILSIDSVHGPRIS